MTAKDRAGRCGFCGGRGHYRATCPKSGAEQLQTALRRVGRARSAMATAERALGRARREYDAAVAELRTAETEHAQRTMETKGAERG